MTFQDKIGLMGWGEFDTDSDERVMRDEKRTLEAAQKVYSAGFRERPMGSLNPAIIQVLKDLHAAKGLEWNGDKGSMDLMLISEQLFQEILDWLAQIIGSCVMSGGMRAWVTRALHEIIVLGSLEEPLGFDKTGFKSIAPFAPQSYGLGRRYGNIRGGDGSFCGVQIRTFMTDGVLPCNTPALHNGPMRNFGQGDYPEPQGRAGAAIYRDFGNWKYLDGMKPHMDFRLLESTEVNDADTVIRKIHEFKPMMICSSWGFRYSHMHKDGFAIYKHADTWHHNMTLIGLRIASDGNIFVKVWNSWGDDAHKDGAYFYVPIEVMAKWAKKASIQTIGDIDLPKSAPLATAV